MNDNEVPVTSESLEQQQQQQHPASSMWTTPVAHGLKPRPATIHEGFAYPIGEDYGALTPWDSSNLPFQQMHGDVLSRPGSVHSFHQPQQPYHNALDNCEFAHESRPQEHETDMLASLDAQAL